jgi:hypothetical protein
MTDPAMLRILKVEIEADLVALDDIGRDLTPLLDRARSGGGTQQELVHAGYLLHNAYNACESILRRIAGTFENALTPDRWHEELLRRMTLEIPGIRPAAIGEDVRASLDELRRFRHFFRHNYAAALRASGIVCVGDAYRVAVPAFREAMRRFLAAVDAILERAEGS